MLKEIEQTKDEVRIGKLCCEYRIKHNLETYKDEIWKWIPDYKSYYLVSNMGWVASIKKDKIHKVTRGGKIRDIHGNIMYIMGLYKYGKRKTYLIHRLVAQVFCYNDNPKEKTIVNHIIERTETECDNRACNLEWVTYKENSKHSSHKISKANKGRKNKIIKLNEPLQLENEVWKSIEEYEGLYEISNLGRVKSLKYNKPRILKQLKNKYGYIFIRLYKNRKSKTYNVHKLVALHFCEGYKEGLVVNHKNHIRDDNRAENLEWVTYEENNKHADNKTQSIICITTCEIFDSIIEGADKYNIKTSSHISDCCNGNINSCGKLEDNTLLIWRYLDEEDNIKFLPSDYEEYVEKIIIKDVNTDEQIYEPFDCLKDVAEYLGKDSGNISNCLNGKRKSSYGYKYKYIKVKNTFIEEANKSLEIAKLKLENNLEN